MPEKVTNDYIINQIDKGIIFTNINQIEKKLKTAHRIFSERIISKEKFSEFLNFDVFKKYIKERKRFCDKIAKANKGAIASWERVGDTIKITSFITCNFTLKIGKIEKGSLDKREVFNFVGLNIYEDYTGTDEMYAQNIFNLCTMYTDIALGKTKGFIMADTNMYAFRGSR